MAEYDINCRRVNSIRIVTSIILMLGLLFSLYPGNSQSGQDTASNSKPVQLEAISMLADKPRNLPEFELIDHNQRTFGKARLRGKWNLMFFGYTNCPDICPITLSLMNNIVNAIEDPDVRDAVKVYFVSVDPERDKPALLATYMAYFNPDFIGATADLKKLNVLTSALGVSHKIRKKSENDLAYTVSHSGYVVLIDPEVRFVGLFFSAPDNVQAVASDLTYLVEHSDY